MPYANAHHGDPAQPFDLAARIDAELRTRIEDAVDLVCLEAMVKARQAGGGPPPAADDPRDREEYHARVRAFLELLRTELAAALSDEQRRRLGKSVAAPGRGDVDAAVRVQVALAKELPDYWQRFDAIRLRAPAGEPPSGGEDRSLLDRLLRRG